MPHTVHVRLLPGCRGRITATELRRIARHVLDAEHIASNTDVEVVLADETTVHNLNRLYRGKDEPTDVLSFASSEDSPSLLAERGLGGEVGDRTQFIEAPDAIPTLGEIVICLPVAESQARAASTKVDGAIAHLLVHGLLHLLGYDHETAAAGSRRMRTREDALLTDLGYDGQYSHGH